jgi:hypothetical protein
MEGPRGRPRPRAGLRDQQDGRGKTRRIRWIALEFLIVAVVLIALEHLAADVAVGIGHGIRAGGDFICDRATDVAEGVRFIVTVFTHGVVG